MFLMSQSLNTVVSQLDAMARFHATRAGIARDPRSAARHLAQVVELRELSATIGGALVELAEFRAAVQTVAPVKAEKPARGRVAKPAKVAKVAKVPAIDAMEFWRLHGEAVECMISIYGRNWKVRAPMGETSLVTITKYRSHKTERGTMLRWGKDHRFPAARYWQGGVYPEGVETLQDYARDTGVPDAGNRSDDWHLAHGYVMRDGNWMPDIMAVAHDIRLDMAAERAAEEMMDDDVKLAAD
jgi:hypothetical protein